MSRARHTTFRRCGDKYARARTHTHAHTVVRVTPRFVAAARVCRQEVLLIVEKGLFYSITRLFGHASPFLAPYLSVARACAYLRVAAHLSLCLCRARARSRSLSLCLSLTPRSLCLPELVIDGLVNLVEQLGHRHLGRVC